jgi:hypothetical protein
MKNREEIQVLRERLAALEARSEGLEAQIQFLRAAHFQRDRLILDMWSRSVETLHVTWEALRAGMPGWQSRHTGGDRAQAEGHSHSEAPGKDEAG